MKRLTERSLDYCTQLCSDEDAISCAFYKGEQEEKCWRANMYDRLAAYEDTGLEPGDIEIMKAANDEMRRSEESRVRLFYGTAIGIQAERCAEIVKAETDCRLVVLPCKVGDTVYHRDCYGKIYEATVQSIVIDKSRTIFITSGIGFDETAVGKTVFLTREEAEKAMEVSEDG